MQHRKTALTLLSTLLAACAAEPPGTSSLDQATTGTVQVTLVWQYMADQGSSSPGHAHAKYFNKIVTGTQFDAYYALAGGHTMDEPDLTEARLEAIEWLDENVVAATVPVALAPPPDIDKTVLVVTGEGTGKL